MGLVYLRLRSFGNGFGGLFFGRFGNRSRGGLGGPFFRRLDNHFRGRLSGLFFGRLRNGFGGRFGGSFGCSFLCEFRGGLLGKHCIRRGGCFGGFRGGLGHGNSCRRGNRGSFGGGLGCRSRGGFCGFLGRGGRGGFRVFLGGGSRDVFQHFRLKNKLKIIHNQTVGLAAQPGQFYKHGNGQTVTLHGVVEIIVGDHGVQAAGGDIQRGKAHNGTDQGDCQRGSNAALLAEGFGFAGQQKQPQGKQRNGNAAQIVDDHIHHDAAEFNVVNDTSRAGEHQSGTHKVEVSVADEQFRHHHCGTQENDNPREPAGYLPGQCGGDDVQQTTQAEGKADQRQEKSRSERSADPVMKQQFQITNCGNQHPAPQIGGFFFPFIPNGFDFIQHWFDFVQHGFDFVQHGFQFIQDGFDFVRYGLFLVHLCFSFGGITGKK